MSDTPSRSTVVRNIVRPEDRHTVDVTADLGGIVIDKTEQLELTAVGNCGSRLGASITRSVDQQSMARVTSRALIQPEARPRSGVADQHKKQDRLQHTNRPRHPGGKGQQDKREQQHAIDQRGLQQSLHCRQAGISEDRAIQAEADKDRQKNRRRSDVDPQL